MNSLNFYITGAKDIEQLGEMAARWLRPGARVLEPFAGLGNINKGIPLYNWTTNDIVDRLGNLDMSCDYEDIPLEHYDAIITNPPFPEKACYILYTIGILSKYTDLMIMVVPCGLMKCRNREALKFLGWSVEEDKPSCNIFNDGAKESTGYQKLGRRKEVRCRLVVLKKMAPNKVPWCFMGCPDIVFAREKKRADLIMKRRSVCGLIVAADDKDHTEDHNFYAYIRFLRNKSFYMKHMGDIAQDIYWYARQYCSNINCVGTEEISHFFENIRRRNLKEESCDE